ncbi:flagellin [Oceanicoccus sp. KOV_DT_Chl]|uniref:flagellin N-terminal helical domain-containing protein n=1 Tax=Oceanicoccus sp. KOV_DT_Chl TaxID=1904639 RepID=UPI000C7B1B4A|nr:flagellin [Oceanicoccus sp. KOV_DT_Chl]
MPQVINTNVASLNAQRNLDKSQGALQTSLQRLSSGLRINSAKDDAAGLAIVDRFTSQIRGLNQAARNASDGISISQVAEGAMAESTNILQRMRELAIQSANGSNSADDRANLNKEVVQLQAELTRIADTTRFGTQKLLDGSFGSQSFQVGANANETIDVDLTQSFTAASLGTESINGSAAVTISGTVSVAGLGTTAAGITSTDTLTIIGVATASVTLAATDSAKTIAAAINTAYDTATGQTGVGAGATAGTASATITFAAATGTAANTINLTVAGDVVSVAIGTASATASQVAVLVFDQLDAMSNGTTATINSAAGTITLVDADGDNIAITASFASAATSIDLGGGLIASTGVSATATATGTVTYATAAQSISSTESGIASLAVSGTGDFTATDLTLAATFATTGVGIAVGNSIADVDISTVSGAQSAIAVTDDAISTIDNARADLGAIQNRLESTISNLTSISENVSAARSRVQDADFASETASLTRNQILQQAGISVLSQANSLPQQVLSLLQ